MKNISEKDMQFYPTPKALAEKMVGYLDGAEELILEPSAGKGDLVDAILLRLKAETRATIDVCEDDDILYELLIGKYSETAQDEMCERKTNLLNRRFQKDPKTGDTKYILTDEEDQELGHLLRMTCALSHSAVHIAGKDFLSFRTSMRYDAIVMNPPFEEGDRHLLRAMRMVKDGGKIICVLNAETIRNAYSNQRKLLQKRLAEMNAEITFESGEFSDAERKSDVEIALIYIKVPESDFEKESYILKGLKKAKEYAPEDTQEEIMPGDPIDQAVAQYNFEINAGMQLYKEYRALAKHMKTTFDSNCRYYTVELKIGTHEFEPNRYVKRVRQKYWDAFFTNEQFTRKLTSNLQETFCKLVNEAAEYEFCRENIEMILRKMSPIMEQSLSETIDTLFEKLSNCHSWYPEMENNIHYYNGWAHNKAHMVNTKKVIIPLNGIYAESWRDDLLNTYYICSVLGDIEKTLSYLAYNSPEMYINRDLGSFIQMASREKQSKNIDLTYFRITLYKKGTCHITWKPETVPLIEKLNILGSKKRGWLPPSYGKKKYEDMSVEEKTVIDEFQGRESYEKVMAKKEFYLETGSEQFLLSATTTEQAW